MLAIASMAVFSIFLRERGSPESKPVGLPHDDDVHRRLTQSVRVVRLGSRLDDPCRDLPQLDVAVRDAFLSMSKASAGVTR